MALTILYAIIIFCILIFAHEFGHLIAAKSVGIRVNEFALGMGPKIISFKRGETVYSWRVFPIGGFCALEGEDGDSDDSRAFHNKNMLQKAWALVAGALMNILLAVIILWLLTFSLGAPSNEIGEVTAGQPAAMSGLLPGDEIISVNSIKVNTWSGLKKSIESVETDTISIIAIREGQEFLFETEAIKDNDGVVKIGITPRIKVMASDFLPSLGRGAISTFVLGKKMIQLFGMLLTGQLGFDDMSGPLGIVQIVGEVSRTGFDNLCFLIAIINLNLAIVNLLPLPALDGGRILFLVIRKITGKRVTDEMEGAVHFVGIFLLFGLMILVTYHDVIKIFFIKQT